MTTTNNLTSKEILELKNSIGKLESSILIIYSNREPRDLLGEEGIFIRTLGDNYKSPQEYESQYYDKRREKYVDTEFSEVLKTLEIYDRNPTQENEIELLLEVGDIIFQKEIVDLKHKQNDEYNVVIKQFDSALSYIIKELEKRNLLFDKAKKLVEIKYGIRAWLGNNGYRSKDKDLERQLCLEV